jgi:hypothetical protein
MMLHVMAQTSSHIAVRVVSVPDTVFRQERREKPPVLRDVR